MKYVKITGVKNNCGDEEYIGQVIKTLPDGTWTRPFKINSTMQDYVLHKFYTFEPLRTPKSLLVSGAHVVEYRNGDKRLYLNGAFISETCGMPSDKYDADLINRDVGNSMTIVAIYEALAGETSLENILAHSDKVVWRRDWDGLEEEIEEIDKRILELQAERTKKLGGLGIG